MAKKWAVAQYGWRNKYEGSYGIAHPPKACFRIVSIHDSKEEAEAKAARKNRKAEMELEDAQSTNDNPLVGVYEAREFVLDDYCSEQELADYSRAELRRELLDNLNK